MDDRTAAAIMAKLESLLLPHQRDLHDRFLVSSGRKYVIRASRRLGKSFLACVLSMLWAMLRPRCQVRYAAPTAKMVRAIIEPHMRDIISALPARYRPTYRRQEGLWTLPHNESQIWVAGCDNGGYERLRGAATDLGVVDEGGFIDELGRVVDDVLMPQTITTDGRLLLLSTPPPSPAHDFVRYDVEAQSNGTHAHRTIYDATHITPEQIEEYQRECGGAGSTTWRREYLAEIVVEESEAVVPEFSRNEDVIVAEHPRPPHFDRYVAADFGWSDLTFVVFGFWDFTGATVVVEDERVWQHANSATVVAGAKEAERHLWGDVAPFLRVADAPRQQLADIQSTHGYQVVLTNKDDKAAQINALRLACAGQGPYKLRIHPRCTALRAHLRHAIWNKRRTEYERSGDHGHFDGVDALLYLIRNISRTRNPYPPLWRGETHATHYIPPTKEQTETQQAWSAVASGLRGRR